MNKGDLVNEVSKVLKTKKDAQAAVDCVLSSITKALEKGESVSLIGFGTFKVADRKARKGIEGSCEIIVSLLVMLHRQGQQWPCVFIMHTFDFCYRLKLITCLNILEPISKTI